MLELKREYLEREKPQREAMCAKPISCKPIDSDKTHLTLFIVFMLVTTLIYMAWSVNQQAAVRESMQRMVDEQREADSKVDRFAKSLRLRNVDVRKELAQ